MAAHLSSLEYFVQNVLTYTQEEGRKKKRSPENVVFIQNRPKSDAITNSLGRMEYFMVEVWMIRAFLKKNIILTIFFTGGI